MFVQEGRTTSPSLASAVAVAADVHQFLPNQRQLLIPLTTKTEVKTEQILYGEESIINFYFLKNVQPSKIFEASNEMEAYTSTLGLLTDSLTHLST